MGGSIVRPKRSNTHGRRSFALRVHRQKQQAEASEVVADTLFNSGPKRQLQICSTIFDTLQRWLPGCAIKGGCAFLLHMQATAASLPHASRKQLEVMIQGMPNNICGLKDLDISCPPEARSNAQWSMIRALSTLTLLLSDVLTELWPEIEGRISERTSLSTGRVDYLVTSYHDGALHPAVNVPRESQVTVAGNVHACLRGFRETYCLGRLKLCFWNAKHGFRVDVPFLDVTTPIVDGVACIAQTSSEVVSVLPFFGSRVFLCSKPTVFGALRRMIFEETHNRPWEHDRYTSKTSRHLMKAFVLAFDMDNFRLPSHFAAFVDEWTIFMHQEKRRAGARRLAYLGVGGVSQGALEDLRRARQKLSRSNLKELLESVLQSCRHAPRCDERTFNKYGEYITELCDVLAWLDLTYGFPTSESTEDGATDEQPFSSHVPSLTAFAFCLPASLRVIEGVVSVLWKMLVAVDAQRLCGLCSEQPGLPTRLASGHWTSHCPACHALLVSAP